MKPRRTSSGVRPKVSEDTLPCGCKRSTFVICPTGLELWQALRDEFPHAMWSGDWGGFNKLRDELENHLAPNQETRRKSRYA